MKNLKIAVAHDNLLHFGGAEDVLEILLKIFPQADIYTIMYKPKAFASSVISQAKIFTSFLDKWPGSHKFYKELFIFYPIAWEQFDFSDYDLVISSSYNLAHGVITGSATKHLVYCYTPSRWLWSSYHDYVNRSDMIGSRFYRAWMKLFMPYIRYWDQQASARADFFIASSQEVQQRIEKYYKRESQVIYPSVDVEQYHPKPDVKKEDYFLTVSRLVAHKRIDLIIEAFKKMPDKKLIIVGSGPEEKKLKSLAQGKGNIEFKGEVNQSEKIKMLQKAKAFIFAAYEDFGLVTVEAQAAGTPVIAYGLGGSLETVKEGKTGIFFKKQGVESLMESIKKFEKISFKKRDLLENSKKFSKERFVEEFKEVCFNA